MPYKLSATLIAHSKDVRLPQSLRNPTLANWPSQVRALASPTKDLVLSASRDTTAISWKRDESGSSFTPSTVLHPGSGYVSSVAYIPPTSEAPQGPSSIYASFLSSFQLTNHFVDNLLGYTVTGGQDSVINVYNIAKGRDEPDRTLLGHKQNVCALQVHEDGTLISGSWDGSVLPRAFARLSLALNWRVTGRRKCGRTSKRSTS